MARFTWFAPLTVALLMLAAPVTPSAAQQTPAAATPIELKLKWPVGVKYVYRMEFDQESSMTPPGQSEPMKQQANMAQEFAFSALKELEGGRREVELEWLAIRMDMTMGGNTVMKYDSKKPDTTAGAAAAIAGTLGKLIGMKLKYIMGPDGRVESIEGLKEIAQKLSDGNPASTELTKSFLDENQLKRLMDAAYLPDHPVKPGDSWPVNIEMPMPPVGLLKLASTVTLTGFEEHKGRKCAVLKTSGTFSMDAAKEQKEGQPLMSVEKGVQEGSTWFDPEKGALIDSAVKQSFTMSIALKLPTAPGGKAGAAGGEDSQTMSMNMVQDVTMTLISEEKVAK